MARQVFPGAGSGDRKSSVADGGQAADVLNADRRRVLIPRSAGWSNTVRRCRSVDASM